MLIGKRIYGRYKIIEMVGGGGMANVYLAQDMILEREVALKILRMDFSNDEEFIRRFNREAQSATSLAHPNIVSIYDVGEEDNIYFIVMEYVRGLTLKQYIQKNHPIPVEKTLDIMSQITAAISHAHQNGIIHRDIKPQNILIDDHGNVKITDFGIAMALSATSITQTNAVLGSVHYLSPEQARGGMANKKSDIYSLGIVMFELLTGRLPFSGESAVSIALKHLQSETPSPRRWNPSTPQSMENIVLKATAKDSFHRYDSVEEMREDIRTSLTPERMREKPFIIPFDDDATKAIPIITSDSHKPPRDETIIRGLTGGTTPIPETKTTKKDSSDPKKASGKTKKEKKPKKKLTTFLITTFVILILLGLATVTLLPKLMAPKEVKVPDVKNESLDEGIAILLDNGFEIGKTFNVEDEETDKGNIISTEPKAGKTVRKGTIVDIFISKGKKSIELTDYTGRNREDIQEFLDSAGFKEIRYNEEFSDDTEPGEILNQFPSPGSEVVPSETVLELTVSKGRDKIVLKDLTQFNRRSLEDYATETGLKIEVDREENSDTIEQGSVISQTPGPYSKVDKGSTVKVVISKGKEEIPPKVETREITIPYEPAIPGQAQEVQIYIEDMNRSMTEPAEIIFITETLKKKIELTIQYGKKAGYKVIRDNSVYLDETIQYPEE
ncbi:Stk1 family PASTA domain-containing Ser/Thr kinase [Peribacillus alkalitolerans]|uniref:Stk1 family PASTA domain-containing Ser/Thr kinase n=1 Tax=Peribacillus alkalitolerans TaxID=1550385 RepID=UPI0013D056C3|nr:Stk1 family PASTA domain-containing Ser/Thr kinase [Peribacillus alkalitolerans]